MAKKIKIDKWKSYLRIPVPKPTRIHRRKIRSRQQIRSELKRGIYTNVEREKYEREKESREKES